MRRRLFNFAAAVSLTLCVAASILWARPNHWHIAVYTTDANGNSRRSYGIAAANSRLQIWRVAGVSGWNPGFEWRYDQLDPARFWEWFDLSNNRWRFAGIAYYHETHSLPVAARGNTFAESVFVVHFAWIAAMAAVLPAGWSIYKIEPRRPGHCRTCGYNLTGNTSGVCPECGTAIGQARAAQ